MRCFRARKRLSAYLDGELNRRRRAAIDEHLGRCRRCAAELDRLKEQWAALSDVGLAPPIPSDLWDDVVEAVDQAERSSWYRLRRVGMVRAACVIVCVILGFAGGALLSWRGPAAERSGPRGPAPEALLVAEAFDFTAFGIDAGREGLVVCVPR